MDNSGQLSFSQAGDGNLLVRLAGAWRLRRGVPSSLLVQREFESVPKVNDVAFEIRI